MEEILLEIVVARGESPPAGRDSLIPMAPVDQNSFNFWQNWLEISHGILRRIDENFDEGSFCISSYLTLT
jgi:hypothetical protein